jgi:hypothetical protein
MYLQLHQKLKKRESNVVLGSHDTMSAPLHSHLTYGFG